MTTLIVSLLIVVGAFFMLVAAIGMLRMPDIFMRMSCNSKAVTLGIGFVLLALALHFGDLRVAGRALAVLAFIALTVPVSSHLIGRAAYRRGARLWSGTHKDELHRFSADPAADTATEHAAPADRP